MPPKTACVQIQLHYACIWKLLLTDSRSSLLSGHDNSHIPVVLLPEGLDDMEEARMHPSEQR